MKTIIVNSCGKCPFRNNDNEYGHDACNLADNLDIDLGLRGWDQLPENTVHEKCPIEGIIEIKIEAG